nr:hypothetical protein BACY1_15440 [Tenacibaculum mesophilum]
MIFQLKRYLTIYESDKFLNILNPENIEVFKIGKEEREALNKVVNKGVTYEEIEGLELYKRLYDKNLLWSNSDFLNKNEINRNYLFLNYINDISKKEIEGIKYTKILIFGVGGAGSLLTYLLAQFGFKNISVVDFDSVEESDVYRISIYDRSDIGKNKAEALKEKISKNFLIDINCYNQRYESKKHLERLILDDSPDIIINACDPKPMFKLDLNEICFKYNLPYMSIAYSYEFLIIGPMYIPTITSCENSFNNKSREKFNEDYEELENIYSDYLTHPSTSFNINILSSFAFKEVLFFILGKFEYCQTIGRRLVLNPLTLRVDSTNVVCSKTCKVCRKKREE